jgi:AraC-like DNA-binding protein
MKAEKHFSKAYLYRRIVEAKMFIDNNYIDAIDVSEIANEACFSKYHFLRLFKASYGKTPYQYLTILRIEEAKRQLSKEGVLVSSVCFDLNFESVTSFSKLFKKHMGMTPIAYVKQQQNQKENIRKEPLAFIPSCFAENFGWTK